MLNILIILNPHLDRVDIHRSSYLTQLAGQDPNREQRAYFFLSPAPQPLAVSLNSAPQFATFHCNLMPTIS